MLLLCSFIFGMWRAESDRHRTTPETIDYYASEEQNQITVIGRISEEPDIRRDKINYTIDVSQLYFPDIESSNKQILNAIQIANSNEENPNNWTEIRGKILISTGKYPSYEYGDTLKISGHLRPPGSFDTFDYAGYLSRYEIYAVIYRPFVKQMEDTLPAKLQESKISHYFFSSLLKVKKAFETQMNRTFSSEPSSSFMAGLLLGSRKGIPEELSEAFRVTGLTHIIAISGYNITLIVSILMGIFRPLGRKASIIISGLGIVLFTLFVGASPAVVRACIMGLLALLALNSNRKSHITTTLFLTAALMIGYNPKILVHDVGFQLSFLATMGLIYVSPLIETYFSWLPEKLAIRESILLTISAQIMALPIILINFQSLSLVSPLSNLLIAGPILPLAMLFGFLGTLMSFISLPIAKLIAYPAYLLLQYVTSMTKLTAQIPYGNIEITWFQKPLFISYFIGLSVFLLWKWHNIHLRHHHIQSLKIMLKQQILYRLHIDKL